MVDRIGKGGPPKPAETGGPTGSRETGKVFDAQRPGAAQPVEQVEKVGSQALDQLKAGKIDFNQYLDMKVQEATQHLHGLGKVELDAIRKMLRDRMATDPELADLVQQATGQVPSPED